MIFSSTDPRDQLLNLLPCQNFDLSMGYRQLKSEPTMFVMLSYSWLIPQAYTIISFGLTNAITMFTWWWKSSDMEILMSCYWAHQQHFVSSLIHVEHPASIGNLCKHFSSCSIHEVSVWMKEVTSSGSRAIDASCRREFEKVYFASSRNHPELVMHVRSALWFDRLAASILYVFLAHQATDWFVQGKGVVVQILGRTRLRYPRWWFPTWTR